MNPAGMSLGWNWLEWISLLSLAAAGLPAFLFAGNIFLFRRPGRDWNRRPLPPVSVLIPARNEELSIAAAVKAVLASKGVAFEIVVMDDGSTDRTAEIVTELGRRDERVRLESSPPLPAGWNGKQHACWALAAKARFELMCFLDADVRVGPEALYRMVSEISHYDLGKAEPSLVSGFPEQETDTFLERLLLPLIHFVLLGFLPLAGERWSGRAGFAAGCGQFTVVRKTAYLACGGHSSIRTTMHDGLLLPQLFRRKGLRTAVFDLSNDAVCRMYRSADEVWRGLSKNATEGMAAPGRIGIFTLLLSFGQVLPWVLLIRADWVQDSRASKLALSAILLGYGVRVLSAWRYKQSWLGALLHPVGILLLLALQWAALFNKLRGRPAVWKARAYRVE